MDKPCPSSGSERETGIKIPRGLIIKLPRLLNMEYTQAELARELDISPRSVHYYIRRGCPSRVDDKGRPWVVGTEFAAWIEATRQRQKRPLQPGQAFCLRCNKPVMMVGPLSIRPTKNKRLELVSGTCAECGAIVNRGRAREIE